MNQPWMKKIKQFERMYFLYEIKYPAQLLKIHEVKKKYSDIFNYSFMSGSSHIRSVLISIEYRNCRRTFKIKKLTFFSIFLSTLLQK